MKRLLLFLCFVPVICFGQSFRADRTRTNPNVADGNGYCFRGHLATETSAYCTEATALFARMTTPPNDARKTAINNFIVGAKAAGVWAKLDVVQMYAAADQQASLLNWIKDDSAITVASPGFTADAGWTMNTPTGYIDTRFNPTASGINYTQNSATFGFSIHTAADVGSGSNGSVIGGSYVYVWLASTTNFSINFNSNSVTAHAGVTAKNHYYTAVRSTSSAGTTYIDKSAVSYTGKTSVTPPNGSVYVGCTNVGSGMAEPNKYEYSCFYAGSALSTTEVEALVDLIEAYMDAVGAGILP